MQSLPASVARFTGPFNVSENASFRNVPSKACRYKKGSNHTCADLQCDNYVAEGRDNSYSTEVGSLHGDFSAKRTPLPRWRLAMQNAPVTASHTQLCTNTCRVG